MMRLADDIVDNEEALDFGEDAAVGSPLAFAVAFTVGFTSKTTTPNRRIQIAFAFCNNRCNDRAGNVRAGRKDRAGS